MYDIAIRRSDEAELDEAATVRSAQVDLRAFEPLYQRYRDRVYAYLRTRSRSAEDAADLTQQVFVQALEALPRYRDRGAPFSAWLFRIARNVAVNEHRRRRDAVTWDLLPESLHPPAHDAPEAQVIHREAASWLHAVLLDCDASTREMLALHFAGGLTIAETAAAVGKSEAAVKKRLSRIVHTLKENYRDPR